MEVDLHDRLPGGVGANTKQPLPIQPQQQQQQQLQQYQSLMTPSHHSVAQHVPPTHNAQDAKPSNPYHRPAASTYALSVAGCETGASAHQGHGQPLHHTFLPIYTGDGAPEEGGRATPIYSKQHIVTPPPKMPTVINAEDKQKRDEKDDVEGIAQGEKVDTFAVKLTTLTPNT
jgi:hypothetical protein